MQPSISGCRTCEQQYPRSPLPIALSADIPAIQPRDGRSRTSGGGASPLERVRRAHGCQCSPELGNWPPQCESEAADSTLLADRSVTPCGGQNACPDSDRGISATPRPSLCRPIAVADTDSGRPTAGGPTEEGRAELQVSDPPGAVRWRGRAMQQSPPAPRGSLGQSG